MSETMTIAQAIEVLKDFNDYRRNAGVYDVDEPCEPKYAASQIGIAIDKAIDALTVVNGCFTDVETPAEEYASLVLADVKVDFNIIDEPWDDYSAGYIDAIEDMVGDAFKAGVLHERQHRGLLSNSETTGEK